MRTVRCVLSHVLAAGYPVLSVHCYHPILLLESILTNRNPTSRPHLHPLAPNMFLVLLNCVLGLLVRRHQVDGGMPPSDIGLADVVATPQRVAYEAFVFGIFVLMIGREIGRATVLTVFSALWISL